MNSPVRALLQWFQTIGNAWNHFWFTPAEPHTLSALRVLAGAMLFYTHLVWSLDLAAFLGESSWVSNEVIREMHRDSWAFSYLWYVESPFLLWLVHLAGLVVVAMFTVGCFTRVTSILAAVITLSYCHRLTGTLFGLDQINAMLVIYLAVGASGGAYSLDRWRTARRGEQGGETPRVSTNIAIRLIQVHLCVIYLFGGIGKMRGEMWWDGSAVWFAIANYEYQSINLTWLVRFPWLIALLTHVTVFWETFYAVLIWPRVTRPVVLALAVMVHGGIALCLGMPTFGLAMIIANMAFLDPATVDAVIQLPRRRFTRRTELAVA